jgi:hypothetical protein
MKMVEAGTLSIISGDKTLIYKATSCCTDNSPPKDMYFGYNKYGRAS